MFGGLGLQGHHDRSSVRNIFEGSFNVYGRGAGKSDIFGGGFKFAASEARKKLDSTFLADRDNIGEQLGRNFE